MEDASTMALKPLRREFLGGLFIIPVAFLCARAEPSANGEPTTAILGALRDEVTLLQAALQDKTETKLLGIPFTTGRLKGRRVVVVASGVGKVNASVTTTLLLDHFKPSEVLFSGVAGGLNRDLKTGDIVIAEKTAQHDLGDYTEDGMQRRGVSNPLNGKRNPTFFPADARLLQAAEKAASRVQLAKIRLGGTEHAPRIVKGVVVTGDVFVASAEKVQELRKALGGDAVEMEGAAVAQICHQQNVPCLIIRCLSDAADANAVADFSVFAPQAAQNAAAMVTEIVEQLQAR
jgi:adenosylhomocysteine nucleosidase